MQFKYDMQRTNEFIDSTISRIEVYVDLAKQSRQRRDIDSEARFLNYIKDEIQWIDDLKRHPIIKVEERSL